MKTNFDDKSLPGRLGAYFQIAVADAVRMHSVPVHALKLAAAKFNRVASGETMQAVAAATHIPVGALKKLPMLLDRAEQAIESTATKIASGKVIEGMPDTAGTLKRGFDHIDAFLTPEGLKQLIDLMPSLPAFQPAT